MSPPPARAAAKPPAKPRGKARVRQVPSPPLQPQLLRWRQAWSGSAGLAAMAVLAVQLVWRGTYLAQGYFTQDDFLVMHLGGTSALGPHFLMQDYSGRLFPGGFAIAFVQARLAPLSWPAAFVPVLLMQLGAGVLMWALLSRLLADRWERLPLLAVFCLCPLTLWSTQWWIVSIHLLPTELCALAAALSYLVWRQDRNTWGWRLTIAFSACGLLFQERAILIPLVVLAVAIAVEPTPGMRRRLLVTLRADQRMWLWLAAVLAVYLLVHAWLAPLVSTGRTSGHQSLTLFANIMFRNFVPGALGGPWSGNVLSGAAIIPPTWAVVVTCGLFAALVAFTVRYGGTTARLAWLILLAYATVDVAMLFGGRSQYAGILGLTPRYTADLVLILVVVLAGVVRGLQPPAAMSSFFDADHGPRRRTIACIAVAVAYAGSTAVTTHHTAPALFNTAGKEYVENLRHDLADQPDAVLYDTAVPASMMISWFGSDDRVSTVYGIAHDAPPFDVPSEHLRIVDGVGHVRELILEHPVAAVPGTAPQCGYNVTLTPTVVRMTEPVTSGKKVMQLAYFTNVDDEGVLVVGGQTVSFPVEPGLHSISVVVRSGFDRFSVRLSHTSGTLCLGAVKAGTPLPAGP
jgi:hypothetical protein